MRRCPPHRNHWEMTARCKSKSRERTRKRLFLLCIDEGFRVLPIVTEDWLHRGMNFRVVLVYIVLVSTPKICRQRLPNHPRFRAWTKWHASQTHERMDRVARRKRCLRFRWLGFSGNDSWEEKIGGCQFDTVRTQH